MKLASLTSLIFLTECYAFQIISPTFRLCGEPMVLYANTEKCNPTSTRRSFSFSLAKGASAGLGFLVSTEPSFAGIDVSGLPVEGSNGNSKLTQELRAYDGSGKTRVEEIKALEPRQLSEATKREKATSESSETKVAHWAYRANPGVLPTLSRAGPFGNLYRINDKVVPPPGSKLRSVGVQFEFPSDWLQLDKAIGGIQYVDQRNGDKLYLLQASLPDDSTLASLSKTALGDLIFDAQGSLSKTGQTIDEYKVVNGQTLVECPDGSCSTRRRFKIKYATVTGNGLRVERRGLVDAYQVENDIYMLMTSSNAVKFEQKESRERETVENIVASFVLEI